MVKNWRPNNVLFSGRLDAAGGADWSMRARTRFTSQKIELVDDIVWPVMAILLLRVYEKNFNLKTSNPRRTATKQLDKNKLKVHFTYLWTYSRALTDIWNNTKTY